MRRMIMVVDNSEGKGNEVSGGSGRTNKRMRISSGRVLWP